MAEEGLLTEAVLKSIAFFSFRGVAASVMGAAEFGIPNADPFFDCPVIGYLVREQFKGALQIGNLLSNFLLMSFKNLAAFL